MNCEPKVVSNFLELVDLYETFIFDCDGVIWEAGTKLDQAFETLNFLREKGKNIFFVTNNSTKSRKKYSQRISSLGFETPKETIYPSSFVAPAYLRIQYPELKNIYMIGMEGLQEECREAGLNVAGGPEDNAKRVMSEQEFTQMGKEESVDAVLVGYDMDFNYYKLCYASACLQNGAKYFATNDDPFDMVSGKRIPTAGALISSLQQSTEKMPLVLGKPNKYAIELIVKHHGVDKNKCLMIGDRIDTDVLIGKNAGIDTCLVFTGVHNQESLLEELKKPDPIIPNFVCKAVCID
jgi:phosphoglycolate phosphatase